MAKPPRPPAPDAPRGKTAADRERAALAELVEVERALAALEGRNVENAEHLVTQRQEAEKRRAALEQIIASSRAEMARRRRLVPYKIGAVVAGVGVAVAIAVPGVRALLEHLGVRDAAAANRTRIAAPFGGRFSAGRSVIGEQAFAVPATKGRCFIVVAATPQGAAHVRVERTVGAREAEGSVGFCSCGAEEARVTLSGQGPIASAVLEADAGRVGGADVLAALPNRPGATFPETIDRACAEEAFDAWAGSRATEAEAPREDQLTADEKALAAQGLAPVMLAAADTPFVLPPAATEACFVAVSRGGAPISLRLAGGERPIDAKNGALGFCAKSTAGLSVWRGGDAPLVLFRATRTRVGGLLGLREAAARGGVSIAVWTPAEDLEQDALATLVASGVVLPVSGLERKRGAAIAVSTGARSMLAASDLGAEVVCHPELAVGASQALCLEARLGAFAPVQKPQGMASAPSPLWLALSGKPDRPALARALDLMAFARRMTADGFEPTSLVGANFTPDGLEVTGRSGDKEIVALVASSAPPYLHTLSAGAPWSLTDPRPTPLTPGKPLRLKATPRFGGRATREFVVFRR